MNKEIILKVKGAIKTIVGETGVKADEPMKDHTTIKLGGPADIFVIPSSSTQLISVVRICRENEMPVFIIGKGTNLIVRDRGIRGVVIKISDAFARVIARGDELEAEAGVLLSRLAEEALENGLTGLEFAAGIPGTLGGAVAMNAGAYGGEMKDVVFRTTFLDKDNNLQIIEGSSHSFSYRDSFIQRDGGIVIKSLLKLHKGDRTEIKKRMDELNSKRACKQPLDMPSAGSVFKRPEGYFTGALIEGCGLRGFTIGGAQVSAKHCGFIVNTGNATSADVINLIKYVSDSVYLKYEVELQTEVKIIGEE